MLQASIFSNNNFQPVTIEKELTPNDYTDLIANYKNGKEAFFPFSWLDFLKTDPKVDAIIDRHTGKQLYINFF